MRRARRLTTAALSTFAVLAGGLMFTAVPALAAEHWGALGAFGSGSSGAGQFNEPSGVAVNDATTGPNAGDVYVVDKGSKRVQEFATGGAFIREFTPPGGFTDPETIAVDNSGSASDPSKEDVYVTDLGDHAVDKFEAGGKYLGQITGTCQEAGEVPPSCKAFDEFSELKGVAVDTKGVVWIENGIENTGGSAIEDFSDEQPNVFLHGRRAETGEHVYPGLAVDAEDNLYIISKGQLNAEKFSSAGEPLGEGDIGGVGGRTGIAVDPANNDLYLDNGSSASIFDSAESPIEDFGAGLLNGAGSLALNPSAGSSGYAYIAEPAANSVLILEHSETAQPPPAKPETGKAEPVTATSATFHGELNPEGVTGGVGYYFSYHAGAGSSCTEPGSVSTPFDNGGTNPIGDSPISVETTVTGLLLPNTEYVFCLVAGRFGGTAGSSKPFTTQAAAPDVISENLVALTAAEGKVSVEGGKNPAGEGNLTAVINPENEATKYFFEYATTAAEVLAGNGTKAEGAPPAAELEGFSPEGQEVFVGGIPLEPAGTVYYRVVATNTNGGTTLGNVQAYTKLPLVENENASALTSTSVRLEATVDPVYIERAKYKLEYATEAAQLGTPQATVVDKGKLTEEEEEKLSKEEEEQLYGHTAVGHTSVNAQFPISAEILSLHPGQTYYYRAVAEDEVTQTTSNANAGEPVDGKIKEFTPYEVPAATTGEAQSITATAATLSGTVDPEGAETSYSFQYISEAAYQAAIAKGAPNPYAEGETTVPVSAGSGNAVQPAGPTPASGLLPGTPYRYELVATNRYGERGVGKEATFTTASATPPMVTTGAVSNVSQNSATLTGTVATSGLQTEYGFEIGTAPGDYGPVTGLGSIGGATTEAVSLTLGELEPGTTYYYRVTASSVDGTVSGEPVSFTTPGFPTLIAPPASPAGFAFAKVAFPAEEKGSGKTVKTLTNKEKLAKALKQCKRDKSKSKRQSCEKAARKKFPTATKKKAKKK
jgi:hypothetical protein